MNPLSACFPPGASRLPGSSGQTSRGATGSEDCTPYREAHLSETRARAGGETFPDPGGSNTEETARPAEDERGRSRKRERRDETNRPCLPGGTRTAGSIAAGPVAADGESGASGDSGNPAARVGTGDAESAPVPGKGSFQANGSGALDGADGRRRVSLPEAGDRSGPRADTRTTGQTGDRAGGAGESAGESAGNGRRVGGFLLREVVREAGSRGDEATWGAVRARLARVVARTDENSRPDPHSPFRRRLHALARRAGTPERVPGVRGKSLQRESQRHPAGHRRSDPAVPGTAPHRPAAVPFSGRENAGAGAGTGTVPAFRNTGVRAFAEDVMTALQARLGGPGAPLSQSTRFSFSSSAFGSVDLHMHAGDGRLAITVTLPRDLQEGFTEACRRELEAALGRHGYGEVEVDVRDRRSQDRRSHRHAAAGGYADDENIRLAEKSSERQEKVSPRTAGSADANRPVRPLP